jgi:hypothetical protein
MHIPLLYKYICITHKKYNRINILYKQINVINSIEPFIHYAIIYSQLQFFYIIIQFTKSAYCNISFL